MSEPAASQAIERTDWSAVGEELARAFAPRASACDADDAFVAESYRELAARRLFSAAVPAELGGGGASYPEVCDLLRRIAHGCGSTALSYSMHTHLLAATVWRHRAGQPVEALLRRIADEQLVLISTGAADWVHSTGRAERVEGGYRVNARKIFGSGSPAGSLLITSACYDDPDEGATVLHFPVPFSAEGVRATDDWRAMGMRGTGSNDVILEDVFVPEGAVSLKRPQGVWHPFFNVIVAIAMPIVMSVYVGVAEAATRLAVEQSRKRRHDPHVPYLLGELENELAVAQMAWRDMVSIVDDYRFEPSNETASAILVRKTLVANAAIRTAEKALETVGGAGFLRGLGLERLVRDVHGGQFHPLPEKRQTHFTGRVTLGMDPLG